MRLSRLCRKWRPMTWKWFRWKIYLLSQQLRHCCIQVWAQCPWDLCHTPCRNNDYWSTVQSHSPNPIGEVLRSAGAHLDFPYLDGKCRHSLPFNLWSQSWSLAQRLRCQRTICCTRRGVGYRYDITVTGYLRLCRIFLALHSYLVTKIYQIFPWAFRMVSRGGPCRRGYKAPCTHFLSIKRINSDVEQSTQSFIINIIISVYTLDCPCVLSYVSFFQLPRDTGVTYLTNWHDTNISALGQGRPCLDHVPQNVCRYFP